MGKWEEASEYCRGEEKTRKTVKLVVGGYQNEYFDDRPELDNEHLGAVLLFC